MKKVFYAAFLLVITIIMVSCATGPAFDLYFTSSAVNAVKFGNDKPEDVTSLVVTLQGLEVHKSSAGQDSGWVSLTPPSGSVDLMSIQGVEDLISSTEITEGSYNQIRFLVSTATVTTESGTYDATVPSTKIHVAVQFDVVSGESTEVVLEWDPDSSLNVTGSDPPKYTLNPVIHVKRVKNPNSYL